MLELVTPEVRAFLEPFQISLETMKDVGGRLGKEMQRGLSKDTHDEATVMMLPTYVDSIPDGTERGDYYSVDFGGSNFRVLHIKLLEDDVRMENKLFQIPKELMMGSGEKLFDFIADCLLNFKEDMASGEDSLSIGFTFSFACRQSGLASGTLVGWTKGFSAEGVEGQDVVKLLKDACMRKGISIDVIALVNDTTGTLMSCAYLEPNTYVGLILGTGTNACYMEDVKNVGTWDGPSDAKETIINMEWGAFGDNGILDDIRTDVDKAVDAICPNPGKQLYEKMISGMYLGEISRQLMVKLAAEGHLFEGKISDELQTEWKFETRFLTDIENDHSIDGKGVRQILTDFDIEPTADDIETVRTMCHIVAVRAANLAVSGLAAVIRQVQKRYDREITVGVDGTLYRKHPVFKRQMEHMIKKLVPNVRVDFMLSEDGSGKGAALIAAVALKRHNKGQDNQG